MGFKDQLRLARLALTLLVGSLLACTTKDLPALSEDDPTAKQAIRAVERALILELASNQATALNRGSYEEAIRKFQRQFEGLRVYERIPIRGSAADLALTEQLIATGPPAMVTIERVTLSTTPNRRRVLPPTSATAFAWQRTDLQEVHAVRFRILALSAASLKRWYGMLPKTLARLLYIRQLTEIPGGWDAKAEVYAFVQPSHIPRHVIQPVPLNERLERAGVALDRPGRQTLSGLAKSVDLAYKLQKGLEEVHQALEPLARSHHLSAQWKLFSDQVSKVQKQTVNRLLGREEEPAERSGHGH